MHTYMMRVLMFIDILLNRPPKFYGDPIKIEEIEENAAVKKSNKINKSEIKRIYQ